MEIIAFEMYRYIKRKEKQKQGYIFDVEFVFSPHNLHTFSGYIRTHLIAPSGPDERR